MTSDYMTLKRCRRQIIRIVSKIDRRDMLMASLEPQAIKPKRDDVQVSPSDRYTEIMCDIADLDAGIEWNKAALRRMRMDALDIIDRQQDARRRYVLIMYYTEFYRASNDRLTAWSVGNLVHDTGWSRGFIYKILRLET